MGGGAVTSTNDDRSQYGVHNHTGDGVGRHNRFVARPTRGRSLDPTSQVSFLRRYVLTRTARPTHGFRATWASAHLRCVVNCAQPPPYFFSVGKQQFLCVNSYSESHSKPTFLRTPISWHASSCHPFVNPLRWQPAGGSGRSWRQKYGRAKRNHGAKEQQPDDVRRK